MYNIIEVTESREEGIFVTKSLPGYRDIPEEEIDYVVNLLRLEDRKVMAVRDVPREDPFEEPPTYSALKWTKRILAASVVTGAIGFAWLYARNSGMIESLTS